jgi:hypothetical protein
MQPWLTECSVVTKRARTLWPAKLASYPGTMPCSPNRRFGLSKTVFDRLPRDGRVGACAFATLSGKVSAVAVYGAAAVNAVGSEAVAGSFETDT